MRAAVINPCFFPPKPYFDYLRNVDVAILLTDVQYVRRRVMNRAKLRDNRWLTIPVRRSKPRVTVAETSIRPAEEWIAQTTERLCKVYGRSMCEGHTLYESIRKLPTYGTNLGLLLYKSIKDTLRYYNIHVPLFTSNDLKDCTEGLFGQRKIIAMCKRLDVDTYVHLAHGRRNYDEVAFKRMGLRFAYFFPEEEMEDGISIIDHALTWWQ